MAFLNNMKIKGRLILGFSLILIILAGIAAYGAMTLLRINDEYSYVLKFPYERYSLLRHIEVDMMESRRIMNRIALYAGNNANIEAYEVNIRDLQARAEEHFRLYRHSLNTDAKLKSNQQGLNDRLNSLTQLEDNVRRHFNENIANTIAEAKAGNQAGAIEHIRVGEPVVAAAYEQFDYLMKVTNDYMSSINRELTNLTWETLTYLLALAFLGLILGMVIAMVITSTLVKPMKNLVRLAADVTQGNLNVNIDRSRLHKDEMGMLTHNIYELIGMIKTLIDDMNHFIHEVNVNGDIEYRTDVTKYSGAYKEIANGVNQIVDGFVTDVLDLLKGLGAVIDGDFQAEVDQKPGKKAILNERFDRLKNDLLVLKNEIANLAGDVTNGDLKTRIDTQKYHGDWQLLMAGLNDLVTAVEGPLSEIGRILHDTAEGNFETRIDAHYKGTFEDMRNAAMLTAERTSDYIKEIAMVLGAIADGDLTVTVQKEYLGSYASIKQSLNAILDALRRTMGEIDTAAEQVLSGANQISQSAMYLAEGSTKQASALEELTASVESINEKTQQNSGSANDANVLSQKSTENAQDGNVAMKSMVSSMSGIKESSSNISKIIKVIEDIAFQTNLLALNAAVEAARAGEHGKGFSVVAEEVRTLAARSSQAAKETTALIEDSIVKVNDGMSAADKTEQSLETIVGDAQQVSTIIAQIANMSAEQAESISQVSIGLSEISSVVHNNSATSEQSASAAQELNSQAEMLKELVSFFKL